MSLYLPAIKKNFKRLKPKNIMRCHHLSKEKAKEFLEKLNQLQEEYGFYLSSDYEEDIDIDYDGNAHISGGSSHLIILDKEGFEVSLDNMVNRFSNCHHCNRTISWFEDFCHKTCQEAFYEKRKK